MEAETKHTGRPVASDDMRPGEARRGGIVPRVLGQAIGTEFITADISDRVVRETRAALGMQGTALQEALQVAIAHEVQRNVAVMDGHLAEQVDERLGRMQDGLGTAMRQLLVGEIGKAVAGMEDRLREVMEAERRRAAMDLEARIAQQLSLLLGEDLDRRLRDLLNETILPDLQQQSRQAVEHLISHLDARTAELQARAEEGWHATLDTGLARHAGLLRAELLGAVAAERTSLAQEVHRQMHHVDSHLSAHLSKELSLQLGIPRREAVATADHRSVQQRLLALGRLLEPAEARGMRKRRVGRLGDGGYVMLDDLERAPFALSLGVGDEMTWDLEMAERGVTVHQFDYTIAAPPETHEHIVFHRSRIAPVAQGTDHSFASAQALGGHKPCIIKMDIEGDEWAVLDAAGETDFARVTQLVIELHDFDRMEDVAWAERAERVLQSLARDFRVVHVHANNNGLYRTIGNIAFPEILEVTFANKKFYEFGPSVDMFPTEWDAPNREDLPEIILGAFRF